MKVLIDSWYLIVAVAAVLLIAGYGIYTFTKRPKSAQMEAVKEWLLYAVTEAEKTLGGGTGQLKLRYVYDIFVDRFPYLSGIITFDMFSRLVDEALEEMRHLLDTNGEIKDYVEGGIGHDRGTIEAESSGNHAGMGREEGIQRLP